jgi:hypothetical protein
MAPLLNEPMKFPTSSMRWFGLQVGAVALVMQAAGVAAQESAPAVSGPLAPLPVAPSELGSVELIEVLEPYAELHMGPHRYFPVFFVAKRGDRITVIGSQGNFLRVRMATGEIGWVPRSELESSLSAAGVGKNTRDALIDRYLKGRLLIGSSIGRLTTETMYDAWARYRITDLLSIQGAIGYQMGDYDGSGFWHVDGIAEPWPTATFSPFVGLGLGQLRDFPQHRSSQLPTTTAFLANVRAGVIYRFGEQFGVRLEAAQYGTIQTDRPIRSLYSISVGMAYAF